MADDPRRIIEEMQEYYKRRAEVYDSSMGYDDPAAVVRLTPVIELMRELLKGRRVLEIACGPCFWTELMSCSASSIIATDANSSVLEEARKKRLDPEKVALRQADAYDLSGVPGKFDGAMAVDWFAHVPRSRFHPFLKNLHDKLEKGAVVVLCDQLPKETSLTGRYDAEGNHLQERISPDGRSFDVIKHFLSDEEISSVFSRYCDKVEARRFPECRRIVVSYVLKEGG